MAELSTLARPYAKALFEVAVDSGDLAAWSKQLSLTATVSQAEKVDKLLHTPSLTSESQAQQFIAVCGDEITAAMQNFIKVLAENKRIPLLPTIATLFEQFKSNREKTVDVEIATVFELDDAIREKISSALKSKLDRDVNLQTTIDKNLIGGVIIRAADVVIDGSLRGRLGKLAETLNA